MHRQIITRWWIWILIMRGMEAYCQVTAPYGWDENGFYVGAEILGETTIRYPAANSQEVPPVFVPVSRGRLYASGFFKEESSRTVEITFDPNPANPLSPLEQLIEFATEYLGVLGRPYAIPLYFGQLNPPNSQGVGITYNPHSGYYGDAILSSYGPEYEFFDWFTLTKMAPNPLGGDLDFIPLVKPNPYRFAPKPSWRWAENSNSPNSNTNGIISFAGDPVSFRITSGTPYSDLYTWTAGGTVMRLTNSPLLDQLSFVADAGNAGHINVTVANSYGIATMPGIVHSVVSPRSPRTATSATVANFADDVRYQPRDIAYCTADNTAITAATKITAGNPTVSKLFKLGAGLQTVWSASLTNLDVQAVAVDTNGSVVIGAIYFDPGPNTAPGLYFTGLRLARLGSSGQIVWQQTLTAKALVSGQDGLLDKVSMVSIAPDGSIFLAGLALGTNMTGGRVDAGLEVAKCAPNGTPLFQVHTGLGQLTPIFDNYVGHHRGGVAPTTNGGCIVTGPTFGAFVLPKADCVPSAVGNSHGAFVGALAVDGSWTWVKCIQSDALTGICGPVREGPDAYYIAGAFADEANILGTPLKTYRGVFSEDGFLLKLNVSGQLAWLRQIPTIGTFSMLTLASQSTGGCLLGGQFEDRIGFLGDRFLGDSLMTSNGTPNVFVCGYSSAGRPMAPLLQVGQTKYASINGLCADSNGNPIVTGVKGDWDPGTFTVLNKSNYVSAFGTGPACVTPSIITPPVDRKVNAGQSVELFIRAEGAPPLTYQWFRNGQLLTAQSAEVLQLNSATPANGGDYTVKITNFCGAVTSAPAHVVVNTSDRVPPLTLIKSPTSEIAITVSQPVLNLTGVAGDNVGLSSVNWSNSLGGQGAAAGLLNWQIANLQLQPGLNQIKVYATDTSSNVHSANLLVTYAQVFDPAEAPWFVEEPKAAEINLGDTLILTSLVMGESPDYQWLLNDIPIPGATSSTLTLPNATFADSGLYAIQVSNSSGSVVSTSALVTVKLPGFAMQKAQELVTRWGTSGSAVGQFNSPQGIAVDGIGNVIVSDAGNNRIQRFSSTGAFLDTWGTAGSGPGEFSSPTGLTIGSDGTIMVVDSGNARIQKFSDIGLYLWKFGSGGNSPGKFYFPNGVALDSDGNIYVADTANFRIQKFSNFGGYLNEWGGFGTAPGLFNYAQGLDVDASGNVFVADKDNHRIQEFQSDGTFVREWGTLGSGDGQFNSPINVKLDNQGRLYVVDFSNDRIQVFSTNAVYLRKFGVQGSQPGEFVHPCAIATDRTGNLLYVADTGNDRVQMFAYLYAPIIANQPKDQVLPAGATATFSVGVVSPTPISYQWQFNDLDLLGATNAILTIQDLAVTNSGSYRVIVANGNATIQSAAAKLIVGPAPLIHSLRGATGDVILRWVAMLGRSYLVQYKTNLSQASWTDLLQLTATADTLTASDSIQASQRFYRIVLLP